MLACGTTSSFDPVADPNYRRDVTPEMVSGAALAALGTNGRFHVEAPATGEGQLAAAEARSQTLQFARFVTNNALLRGVVEGGRGGYWTDPHLLTLCADPPHFVHSQLSIPVDTFSIPAREDILQRYGPQWLVALCGSDNEPQMVVQAAVDGNSIRFADGELVGEYRGVTTAWFARGVQLHWPDVLPISRERAVRFAFETFGVRVSEVPDLIFRGERLHEGHLVWQVGAAPNCNRWRVVLESDVNIRGLSSLRTVVTDTVYIAGAFCGGRDPIIWLPLPEQEQPASVILDYGLPVYGVSWVVNAPVVSPIRFELASRVQ